VAAWKKDPRGAEFQQLDAKLRTCVEEFRQARDEELKQDPVAARPPVDSP
jgi:hypothetical protein